LGTCFYIKGFSTKSKLTQNKTINQCVYFSADEVQVHVGGEGGKIPTFLPVSAAAMLIILLNVSFNKFNTI